MQPCQWGAEGAIPSDFNHLRAYSTGLLLPHWFSAPNSCRYMCSEAEMEQACFKWDQGDLTSVLIFSFGPLVGFWCKQGVSSGWAEKGSSCSYTALGMRIEEAWRRRDHLRKSQIFTGNSEAHHWGFNIFSARIALVDCPGDVVQR